MNDEQANNELEQKPKGFFKKFSGQFWLVVMFEFFERGAYYGMMSFLSQYFVDTLHIPKESVGVIKGVIQPLLYFLPILAGAIADRFGYRRILMVAFTLLGGGYFLTSQMTSYTAVFGALVIMGFGAGTFKPMISGTIARITDESNSTQAFGIYYWSINVGAFLFPLFLVPILKSINPTYVIIASGICTGAMIIPTALFFKEPVKQKAAEDKAKLREQTSLLQTVANAFEIIYSPIVLLFNLMKKSGISRTVIIIVLIVLLGYSGFQYTEQEPASGKFPTIGIEMDNGNKTLMLAVDRNMLKKDPYLLKMPEKESDPPAKLTVYKPQYMDEYIETLRQELQDKAGFTATPEEIRAYINTSIDKIEILFELDSASEADFRIEKLSETQYKVFLKDIDDYETYRENLLERLHETPTLRGLTIKDCDSLHAGLKGRSFFLFFVISLILLGLIIVAVTSRGRRGENAGNTGGAGYFVTVFLVPAVIVAIWFLPGLTPLGQIISSVIYLSIMSLFIIDKSDTHKFADHAKFLLMIVLYSGFWVLYFQMFDSVLWYVQAYVDAASLNNAINSFLGLFGAQTNWFFDVEHVTVINAGTIIVLQLVISSIVKNKKAMPTMITGIVIATIGMAMLAVSTHIWVFMAGITIFSIGEMTAHPKFISYVGLTAPTDKKAMYMGYIFLYGVFGSSVGGIVGAKLYVHFVDNLNQPRTLWIVFSMIGVVTVISLLLYNKFLVPKKAGNS